MVGTKEELGQVVVDNSKLIHSVIKTYFSNYPDHEDLYQVGTIGLINAYKNFNKDAGSKLSTYAYMYIYGEIAKYVRENKNIKISKEVGTLKRKIEEANILLTQKLMRKPSIHEVSLFLNVDENILEETLNINTVTESLDRSFSESSEKELNMYDLISRKEEYDKEDLILLRDRLNNLSSEEKKIITSHLYGYTQEEIADSMNMYQVEVSRQKSKILEKIRRNVA